MDGRLRRPQDGPVRIAWDVAERLLSEELPRRWRHSQGVFRRALMVREDLPAGDGNVLAQAAILHDIGYASHLKFTGFHPVDGARYLRSIGWDDLVVDLVAHHSCARVKAEQLGLSAAISEFDPGPPELTDFLIYCDMTTSADGEPVTVDERFAEKLERYGSDSIKARSIDLSKHELQAATLRVAIRLDASSRLSFAERQAQTELMSPPRY
jgi:putative nucleotidyltransferase with HDIG domain